MRYTHPWLLLSLVFLAPQVAAQDVVHYVCKIGGVYESVGGKLVPRANDKAAGQDI